ncbi:cell adhesion molecule 3-like [Saccostrea cucullata]|uniref:cell adhesion molecule 3-like n=1 Tax=Saccostrea cuccullata TaxID=36930 RepID=UPI002ED2A75C
MEDINATLVLNCSFTEESEESIEPGFAIKWKSGNGDNIAGFSKPGGDNPKYYSPGEYLRNRSELINPTENSSSALIFINEIVCDDEKPSYKCTVRFDHALNGDDEEPSSEISISLRKSARRPLDIQLISNSELKENQDLQLNCVADVGKPPGIAKWWKIPTENNFILIKESDQMFDEAGNCEFLTNVNITYKVTREDNGAFFRCTSHSNKSKDEGPEDTLLYRDTIKINVLYEAIVRSIIRVPELDVYPISTSKLNITCVADGNPAPTDDDCNWISQAANSNTTEKITSNGKFLILQNLQESDSGTYTCSVSNSLNSTHSSNITIIVNGTIPEPLPVLHCRSNPCGVLENCVDLGQVYSCETNALSVVGVLFLILTIASLAVSFGLAYYIRKLHKISKIGVQNGSFSNGKATAYPTIENKSDVKTCNTTVSQEETNDAIYAQINNSESSQPCSQP